ncbi:MAG TPA: DNA-primase RepB domain-containing protein [Vicinamibacterales bacterium]|nr:DNA-primase RepB domain-containing protein [Vicinamibacterales bacterium]
MAIDLEAPIQFLRSAFHPDDWIAVLLKSHDTGGTAQRVGPLSLIASAKFQAWLRAENARRFSVFVSVNAIRPQRKARTRDAIGEVRHVFLDADRDGGAVLTAIAGRHDLPPPSFVLRSSPNRLHVLWRVSGFSKEGVEALQKQLARELGTDKAATSCAQLTRLPGFFNHKYRPAPVVVAEYSPARREFRPSDFPSAATVSSPNVVTVAVRDPSPKIEVRERARRYLAAIPPAVGGQHGDTTTFRVCCRLVRGFALEDDDALAVLSEWNCACSPPWSEEELRAKLKSARRYGREPVGGLLVSRLG